MQIRNLLVTATVLALPVAAQAQPVTGLYIGAGAGVNFQQNQDISSVNGVSTNTHLDSQAGAVGVLSLGWGFGNGLRLEVEGDYRYNGYSKLALPSASVTIGGNTQKYGPMVNMFYDFTTVSPAVIPYIGAGIGYQWVSQQLNSVSIGPGTVTTDRSGTEGAFAYQAIVGAAFPIHSVPGLAITTEGRFMGITERSHTTQGVTIKSGNEFNYAALIGVRYNFGVAPPPAPMPIAAPAPAQARRRRVRSRSSGRRRTIRPV
jgi:opacity protein-like surface antigen